MISAVENVVITYDKNLACHWPRQGGIWTWGKEILIGYIETPCRYADISDTDHGQKGFWKNAYIRLKRSKDGGQTWVDAGKLFDNSLSVKVQRDKLHLYRFPDIFTQEKGITYRHYFEKNNPENFPLRESIDCCNDDAIVFMGRAWCGNEVTLADGTVSYRNVPFAFRSADKGYTWEEIPTIVFPNQTYSLVELANNSFCDGGRVFAWFVGYDGVEGERLHEGLQPLYAPQLYASDNNGETFDFYQEIYSDPFNRIAASYPHIIRLPSGRWLCFLSMWYPKGTSRNRWTTMQYSDDRGLNWSTPKTIQSWCTAPYPVRLADGRIVVISMRRNPDPTGLTVIISEDDGCTWSEPAFVRQDTLKAGPVGGVDGGYPVAVEIENNRIFTAYYWQKDDKDIPWYGGRKFIAGTFFTV